MIGSIASAQCEVQAIFEADGLGNRLAMNDEFALLRPCTTLSPEPYIVVYRRTGLELAAESVLLSPSGEDASHSFGSGMYGDNDRIVVGEHLLNRVHFFQHDGNEWQHQQTIVAPSSGGFGRAVAISGDTLIVGAPHWTDSWATNIGTAYVYRFNGSEWEIEQELVNPDPYFWEPGMPFVHPDHYGAAVGIHGNVAVVSAPTAKANAGRVYVYEHDGEQWVHTQTFAPDPPDAISMLGANVGIGEDFIMASAHKGEGHGRIYFFWEDGTTTFIKGEDYPIALPSPNYGTPHFGESAALHPDGTHVLAGYYVDSEAALGAGAAFLLRREGKEWPLQKKLIGSNVSSGNSWGGTLATAGDFALVGAINATNPGKVHLFAGVKGEDCNDSGQPDACDIFFGDSSDANENLIPDECETPSIPGDLTGDGAVGVADLLILLGAWGPCRECSTIACPADLDGNCEVGVGDLLILLANWGP